MHGSSSARLARGSHKYRFGGHMNDQQRRDDIRLVEARSFFKDADNVELKVTVADDDRTSATAALGLDVVDADLRQVVFFDTPDLALDRAGLIVRARRTRKGGDATVKLRPVVPASLPPKLRRTKGFKVEVDVTPGGFVCSASLKACADNDDIRKVLAGKKAVRKLFSEQQRAFYTKHAPDGLELDALTPFGPINVAKLKFTLQINRAHEATTELWFYPDSTRILELSTKCASDETFQVMAEARALLRECGIQRAADQQTKTRKALDYFSHLVAQPA
jgi:hypothetical protein